jgi:hypothetical protein
MITKNHNLTIDKAKLQKHVRFLRFLCRFGLRYFIETFIQINRDTHNLAHILQIHAPFIHTKEAKEEKKRERRGKNRKEIGS